MDSLVGTLIVIVYLVLSTLALGVVVRSTLVVFDERCVRVSEWLNVVRVKC